MSNLLGIDTPARLLRQQWGSPTELAEELYAMFTAKGPAEVHDTLTIRVPEGKPALRIERSQAGDVNTTEFHHGGITKGRPAPASTPRARDPRFGGSPETDPRRHITGLLDSEGQAAIREGRPRNPAPTPRTFQDVPLVEIDGGVSFTGHTPVEFSTPPILVNAKTGRREDLADAVARKVRPGQPDDQKPLFGKVVSGSGAEYVVDLFPNGPGKETTGAVSVRVPYIADDETIDPGTWLTGIMKFDDGYWVQPPVWMP